MHIYICERQKPIAVFLWQHCTIKFGCTILNLSSVDGVLSAQNSQNVVKVSCSCMCVSQDSIFQVDVIRQTLPTDFMDE